jgi:hypothetical protein
MLARVRTTAASVLLRRSLSSSVTQVDVEDEKKPVAMDPNAVKQVDLAFCDIFKNEQVPRPRTNKEYPEWLWRITEKAPHLEDLDLVEWDMFADEDKKRLFKFERRRKIKQHNASSRRD